MDENSQEINNEKNENTETGNHFCAERGGVINTILLAITRLRYRSRKALYLATRSSGRCFNLRRPITLDSFEQSTFGELLYGDPAWDFGH